MANISHLGVLSFITPQTELSQSSTHMNYVNAVLKAELYLKAFLTSLNMAFLPISRLRFKQRQIAPFETITNVLCTFAGDFWAFWEEIFFS